MPGCTIFALGTTDGCVTICVGRDAFVARMRVGVRVGVGEAVGDGVWVGLGVSVEVGVGVSVGARTAISFVGRDVAVGERLVLVAVGSGSGTAQADMSINTTRFKIRNLRARTMIYIFASF